LARLEGRTTSLIARAAHTLTVIFFGPETRLSFIVSSFLCWLVVDLSCFQKRCSTMLQLLDPISLPASGQPGKDRNHGRGKNRNPNWRYSAGVAR